MNTDGLLLEGLGEKENYFQARVSIDCEQSLFFFFRDTVECEHEHSTKQNMASQRSNRHSLTEEIQEKPAKISRSLYSCPNRKYGSSWRASLGDCSFKEDLAVETRINVKEDYNCRDSLFLSILAAR